MERKTFKVQSIVGNSLEVVVEGVPLEQIEADDFVVFRTSQHLNQEGTAALVAALNDLAGSKRAILLPKFIERVVFIKE